MATYRLRDVKRRLTRLGATFESQRGRPHANVKLGGRKARWPNPHDDPIDDNSSRASWSNWASHVMTTSEPLRQVAR